MKKILIVDDDEGMRSLLKLIASGMNVETIEAPDGESALLSIEEGSEPDLVLLDLHLPHSSGKQVFDAIRRKSKVAVVIVTADLVAAPEFINKADAVFTKPFRLTEFIFKLTSLLSTSRKK